MDSNLTHPSSHDGLLGAGFLIQKKPGSWSGRGIGKPEREVFYCGQLGKGVTVL